MAHRRTSKRKTSRKPKKVRRNIRVSVPRPSGSTRSLETWYERTFAPGTPVMTMASMYAAPSARGRLKFAGGPRIGAVLISAGARGVVRSINVDPRSLVPEIVVEIVDARDAHGSRIDGIIGQTFLTLNSDAIEPLVDNWAAAPKHYAAARPRKTTSRRVRPNTIPPPPDDQSLFRYWFAKTFATGTTVRLLDGFYGDDAKEDTVWVPAGSTGIVYRLDINREEIGVAVNMQVPLFTSAAKQRVWVNMVWFRAVGSVGPWAPKPGDKRSVPGIEPLDDHWGPLVPPKRYAAPRPRKTTSRRVRPNTIPPPPESGEALIQWAQKTYAAGTSVRLRRPLTGSVDLQVGSTGRTLGVDNFSGAVDIEFISLVPLFTSTTERRHRIRFGVYDIWEYLEPLDDNWGPLVPPKRYAAPRPRKTTSRRVRPNATCPSCGSPHYFESMWHRDCATPTCEYFRGGKISGPEATPELETRSGAGRSILVTYSTVTPTDDENGEYEQEHGEVSETSVDESDLDLDNETFAEWAAEFIARELGHVEDNHDGTYYQSDYHTLDYGTGEQQQLAAHLRPPEAWADDLDKIHEILKNKRLL